MNVSGPVMRALANVQLREEQVLRGFTPPDYGASEDTLMLTPPPNAFLLLKDSRGALQFSREGTFRLSGSFITDDGGRQLLGFATPHSALGPLRVDAVDAALGIAATPRVEADGSIVYDRATVDPRTSRGTTQTVSAGRLALARFPMGAALQWIDGVRALAPRDVSPHIGSAGDGNFERIAPFSGAMESRNLDDGLQRLQDSYLALEALQAADVAQARTEKTAMDLLK